MQFYRFYCAKRTVFYYAYIAADCSACLCKMILYRLHCFYGDKIQMFSVELLKAAIASWNLYGIEL